MYDEKKLKLMFLNTVDVNKKNKLIVIFNELESAELSLEKDIAELDEMELVTILKNIRYKHYADLSIKKSLLNEYFAFHNNNIFSMYDLEDLRLLCTYVDDSIYSYEKMKEKELKLNEVDKGWYYNAVLFCAFYGFNTKNVEDFVNLRKSNIDFDNNIIKFDNGKIIGMSDKPELSHYLQLVINNDCNYSNSNNAIAYKGIHDDSVFKVVVNKKTKDIKNALENSIIRNATRSIKAYTEDKNLTLANVSYSGLLYMIYGITKKAGIGYVEFLNNNKNNLELSQYLIDFGKTVPLSRFKFVLKSYFVLYDDG
jgi:hypothetical protein